MGNSAQHHPCKENIMKIVNSVSNTITKTLGAIDNLVDAISGVTGILKSAVDQSVLEQQIESLQEYNLQIKDSNLTEEQIATLKASL
jgi:hypothetical protein